VKSQLPLLVGLAVMEALWVYPLGLLLGVWLTTDRARPLLSAPSVFALVLIGALATQLVVRRLPTVSSRQWTLLALGAACIAVAVRAQYFPASGAIDWLGDLVKGVAVLLGRPTAPALAVGLGVFLWWRGVSIGSHTSDFMDVEIAFRWGIGGLILLGGTLAIAAPPGLRSQLEAEAAPFVVAFFFISLLTLALARLESMRSSARQLGVNTQWLGVLIAVSGLLVLTALVIAQVLSFDLVVAATRPIFDFIGLVLLIVLLITIIPIAYLVELIMYLILQLVRPEADRPPPEPRDPSEIEEFLRRLFSQGLPDEIVDAMRVAGVVALLALGLLLIARAVARWRPSMLTADAADEERETLWDPERVKQRLLAWLRGLFRRRRPQQAPTAAAAREIGDAAAEDRERSVREIYRRLLRLGSSAGALRAPAETPFEHLPTLDRALEPQSELQQLTDAYVLARYAEQPSSSDEVDALKERLDRVRHRANEGNGTEPDSEASRPG
jgi:hypothetical protein